MISAAPLPEASRPELAPVMSLDSAISTFLAILEGASRFPAKTMNASSGAWHNSAGRLQEFSR
jgi:hypothetical protein